MKPSNRSAMAGVVMACVLALWGCTATVYTPPPPGPAPGPPLGLLFADLRVTDLDMAPDPIVGGERPRFMVTIHNRSHHSATIRLFLMDRDELIAETGGIGIRPGANRINLPRSGYRFHRSDHCFVVEVDLAGTRRSVDVARRFCARRTAGGWTLR